MVDAKELVVKVCTKLLRSPGQADRSIVAILELLSQFEAMGGGEIPVDVVMSIYEGSYSYENAAKSLDNWG